MATHAEIVKKCYEWLSGNFEPQISTAFKNTPFQPKHIYGIAWVESGELWPNLIGQPGYDPQRILSLCVLDGSGDVAGTSRSAFPRNLAAFRKVYDAEFAEMLIDEGNKGRVARGFKPAKVLYKGYGLFQYDLQFVKKDETFFRDKRWYDVEECLQRLRDELVAAHESAGDIPGAIRRYNGSGPKAVQYANDVFHFIHDLESLGLVQ